VLDLRSKARQRLLVYYFTNPTARHHLRDLAERLSIDPSNLSKERLEREGLFRSEEVLQTTPEKRAKEQTLRDLVYLALGQM